MGLFTFLRSPDINAGVAEFQKNAGSVLLDVRTAEEYAQGHIDESINLPLDRLAAIENIIKDKSVPLYVYCLSGSRSARAVFYLKQIGYTNVTNIGGISAYRGEAVR